MLRLKCTFLFWVDAAGMARQLLIGWSARAGRADPDQCDDVLRVHAVETHSHGGATLGLHRVENGTVGLKHLRRRQLANELANGQLQYP